MWTSRFNPAAWNTVSNNCSNYCSQWDVFSSETAGTLEGRRWHLKSTCSGSEDGLGLQLIQEHMGKTAEFLGVPNVSKNLRHTWHCSEQNRLVMSMTLIWSWMLEEPWQPQPASWANTANIRSASIEMRQATNGSGIIHCSHCSLPFTPGLASILLCIWDILFCL